jgi:hypothetical protein
MKIAKSIILSFFVSVLLIVNNDIAFAQSTWDRYIKRTFQEIIELHRGAIGEADHLYTAHDFAARVSVVYLGKQRPINTRKAQFLDNYFKGLGNPKVRSLLESEILVSEGNTQYWLPIQKDLLLHLEEEVKTGERLIVFVAWLGVYKEDAHFEWVFIINGFDSTQSK